MTILKELTWDKHKKAETTPFMKRLAKKQLSPKEYYTFLANQYMMYKYLEEAGDAIGLFDDMESIKRVVAIDTDMRELESEHGFAYAEMTDAAMDYMNHIESISNDRDKLLAHCYVRYFGDLSGGQILKRLVPGSAAYYNFEEDVNELKSRLASKLNDSMAEEANECFEMMTKFLIELDEDDNDSSMG